MIPSNRVAGLISVALFIEYEATLKRPEQIAATGLSEVDIDAVLDMIAGRFRIVTPHYLWRPQLRDPSDEMVLELAVNGGADAIVTFNAGDFAGAAARFGVKLMAPGEFLRALGKEKRR